VLQLNEWSFIIEVKEIRYMNPVMISLLLFLGLSMFANTMSKRLWLLYAAEPENRINSPFQRLLQLIKIGFGQQRLLFEPAAGLMHVVIFFGFLVVAIRTITLFGQGFNADFHIPGSIGQIYAFIKDSFAVLVIVALFYALIRRLITKPTRLHLSTEAVIVLLMIMALMVTDFIGDAALFVLHPSSHDFGFAWAGTALMPIFQNAHPDAILLWFNWMYWVHVVLIMVFLNFLPFGKHFHVLTALANVFTMRLDAPGTLERMEFEGKEIFGVGKVEDFTWPRMLDMFSCTECGRCTVHCPTSVTGKPLQPRDLICDQRDHLYSINEQLQKVGQLKVAGKLEEANKLSASIEREALTGGIISEDVIWGCTTCGYCQTVCPVGIEHIPNIIDMRRYLTMMEAKMPSELAVSLKGLETNSNPWNVSAQAREDWIGDLEVPKLRDKGTSEYLLWVGCAGAYDDRNQEVVKSLCRLLNIAGVDYAVLGTEEACCGDPARRMGHEYLFEMQAQQNIAAIQKYGVKKVISACPHCFHMLANEYGQFDVELEVLHHSELLNQLVSEGKLKVSGNDVSKITYHDSCYLARHNGIESAPRELLGSTGADLTEMPRHGREGFCCGAGGARMFMEEDLGTRINHERTNEASETGADEVCTACPFCLTMLADGIKETDREDSMKALDIAEVIERNLIN
jgi:Fe-S oxidoreductase/nitrate reductase gamma subunit